MYNPLGEVWFFEIWFSLGFVFTTLEYPSWHGISFSEIQSCHKEGVQGIP